MRTVLRVFAVLLGLGGAVSFFEVIGMLPGSFMSGDPRWAAYGVLAVLAGVGLFVLARRRPTPPSG